MEEAPVPIEAGWALWGKNQGTRIDYSVLACSSEPLSEAEFASVLTHFVAGTPPAERDRPDSLPWVIISRVGIADHVYVGISVQAPAGTTDAAGRPIISTSYFCIPYAAVSGTPVTYSGLYQRLDQEVRLPYRDDGLIPLGVPRLDPGALARDVGTLGESVVVATAAMLLSGPVSIVGAEAAELADRLRFIDTVAALLPYGYRTAYTAATWSDSGTRHPIRLAFASRPRQNAGVIRWGMGPATPITGATEDYLAQYRQVRDRLRGADPAARVEQLAKLIDALARDGAPCGFDQPERALAAMRDFDLPFVVHAEVRAGSADSADVRRVFTESRIDALEPHQRLEMLAELIATAHRDPANWPVADAWWEHVTRGDSLPLLLRIVRTVQNLLLASAPRVTIREYLTRADTHGILDPMLAGLIAEPGAGSLASRTARAQAVAEQVADSVSREAGPVAFSQTQQALGGNPLVASLLLAHLVGAQRELEPVLSWLEQVLDGTLALFFTVLGQAPAIVDRHEIEALAGSDAGCVAALLTAAYGRGHLDLVLPGFSGWLGHVLLDAGSADPDMVRYCRNYAVALRPAGPQTQAQLDLVLLISGDPPQFLLERRDKPSQQRYDEQAARSWAALADDLGPAGDKALTRALREFLTGGRWAHDGAHAAAVIGLVGPLTRDGQRPSLRTAVTDVLTRTPAARGWSFAQEWLPPAPPSLRPGIEGRPLAPESRGSGTHDGRHSAEPYDGGTRDQHEYPPPKTYQPPTPPEYEPAHAAVSRPETRGAKPAASGNVLSEDATAAEVAEYCTRAFRDRRPLGDVIDMMFRARVIRSGAQAAAVLGELQPSLVSLSGKYPEAESWLQALTMHFADGRFGPDTAAEFRMLVAQSSIEDITRHIEVLRIVVARDEHGLFEPHENRSEQLNRAIKSLEEIRRDGKKRSRGISIARWTGRQGGEGGGEAG